MRTIFAIVAVSLACFLPAAPAQAQHAKFVLFGDRNPNADVGPERTFVHPVTAPYFHEDSFVTTDVRVWAIYHDFPKSSPVSGGNAKLIAAQLRVALTDKIQFVAYKDGYIDWSTGLLDENGWQDIGAGIKFNFLQDWEKDLHAAAGAGYEFSVGDSDILQDDSEARVWASINKGFDRIHLGAMANVFWADGRDDGVGGSSDRWSWHLHADYFVTDWFSPVIEVNGYHAIHASSPGIPFQGVDVANLGNASSESVITAGFGAEFRPKPNIGLRAAYEMPLTSNEDLFGYRWTFSFVWSF